MFTLKSIYKSLRQRMHIKDVSNQLAEIRLYAKDIEALYALRHDTNDPQDKASLDYTITHAIKALEYVTKQLETRKRG